MTAAPQQTALAADTTCTLWQERTPGGFNSGSVPITTVARWTIATGLTLAILMDALNGTIFTIARLHIMGDVSATPDEVAWFNLAYLMAKVACLPAAAWAVDRFGETRTLFWSLALVAASSLLCALPLELNTFIAARILQGAAGAILLVTAQTILFRLFDSRSQGLVQALYALGAVMAPTSLAPAIQGWFTDDFSWTFVFWLNLGLAALALSCLLPFQSLLPDCRRNIRPFDWIGFSLFSLSMTALVYVLIEGPRWNWLEDHHIVTWAVAGGLSLILTAAWSFARRGRSETFDRTVFTDGHFSFGFFVSFVAGFALFGSAFLIPAFAFNALSLPPSDAGLLLLPASLFVGAGLILAGALVSLKNINPLKFVPLGVGLVMLAMWMLSWSGIGSGAHDLWPGLALRGLGLGFLFLAITLVTLKGLRPDHVASGVALFNFGRQMGGIIGISCLNSYLNSQIALNRRILIENINPANLPFQNHQAALATLLEGRGLDPGHAAAGAAAVIQKAIQTQVATLSFNEAFFSLVLLFVAAIPMILLFKIMQKLTGWGY